MKKGMALNINQSKLPNPIGLKISVVDTDPKLLAGSGFEMNLK